MVEVGWRFLPGAGRFGYSNDSVTSVTPRHLSIVLPIHNEEENLRPLLAEIEEVLDASGHTYEVIAIDDGSSDGSRALLRQLVTEKPYLKSVFFRHNYGQAAAFDAGFRSAGGDIVITMDADLQNDPHDIPKMIALLDEGYDFVAGNRAVRNDDLFLRTLPSRIANFLIRRITHTKLRDLGCSLKVYRREISDELRLYGEMHRFISVLAEGVGARTAEVIVNHRRRRAGKSKYGLLRTFKVLLDLVTVWFMRGYQTKPIYVFGGIGSMLVLSSMVMIATVAYQKFVHGIYVHLQPLFIVGMLFAVLGVQFVGMGLIAELLIRVYFESHQRPSYHIAERLGFASTRGGGGRAIENLPERLSS